MKGLLNTIRLAYRIKLSYFDLNANFAYSFQVENQSLQFLNDEFSYLEKKI